jgi:hypothetical protein
MRQVLPLAVSIALAVTAFAATPTAVAAQLAVTSGVRALPVHSPTSPAPLLDTARVTSRVPTRLGLALLGGLTGLFAGAILAAELELGVDCDCDDPELGHAVSGAVVGVALGAALLAAVPGDAVPCAYSGRLWRGVLGGALGVALGFVAPTDARIVTVPLGGIVGAALGAESCAWQRQN